MNRGKKFISIFLVFSIFALSGNLMAKERRGADLIITKKDRQQVSGELIAVKEKSLLLLDAETRADISVDINDIRVIKVKKSASSSDVGLGFLAGATIGFLVGYLTETWCPRAIIGGIGAAIGGLIGAVLTAVEGELTIDKTIQIEGKSPEEVKEDLVYLRSKARIPDYQ
jgi:hypothetical protein